MKPIALALIVLSLSPQLLTAQDLPNAPVPMQPDPAWNRVRALPPGQPLIVVVENAPAVHCEFSQATDAYLFCNPAGNPPGVGYRFDRAQVISVDFDLPPYPQAGYTPPRSSWHPGLLATAAALGITFGAVAAERSNNPEAGVVVGLVSAGMVLSIGYPMFDRGRRPAVGWEFPLAGFAGVRRTRMSHPILRRPIGR